LIELCEYQRVFVINISTRTVVECSNVYVLYVQVSLPF